MVETTSTLLSLADRCEAAAEYEGRLMAEIDCALLYSSNTRPAEPDDHPDVIDRRFDPSSIWVPTGWLMSHDYWRSVDAALAALPKGWRLRYLGRPPHDRWCAQIANDAADDDIGDNELSFVSRTANSAGMAIIATILRARATLTQEPAK